MKKIKMGLLAFAALTGMSSAFAINHPKKVAGTTYYGILSGTDAKWTLNRPERLSCGSDEHAIACTITSTAPQADVLSTVNALPPQSTVQHNSGGEIFK